MLLVVAVEGLTITRSKLQLVSVVTMFLASKVEEVNALAYSDLVYITDHAYTEDAIEQMEKTGNVDVLQHSLVKFAIELALLEYELVPVPGSKLDASP